MDEFEPSSTNGKLKAFHTESTESFHNMTTENTEQIFFSVFSVSQSLCPLCELLFTAMIERAKL